MTKTEDEFIKAEMTLWGEDYIFDLIERGYTPKLTNLGWRWFYSSGQVDTAADLCYAGGVGAR